MLKIWRVIFIILPIIHPLYGKEITPISSEGESCPAGVSYHYKYHLRHGDADQLSRTSDIFVQRLRRHGAVPVVLSHAVVLSHRAMRPLGCMLYNKGYDVWMPNTRGHGHGIEKTTVSPYRPGDYGFDPIASEDWPELLKSIFDETRQKIYIMGYSMGGMSWEQSLGGAYRAGREGVLFSEEKSQNRQSMVQGFISLVVPRSLRDISPTVQKLLRPLGAAIKPYHFFLPLNTNHNSAEANWWRLDNLFRYSALKLINPFFHLILPNGIVVGRNYSRSEIHNMVYEHLSSPHSDIVTQMIDWFDAPYAPKVGAEAYNGHHKLKIPHLAIFAGDDLLAPPEVNIKILLDSQSAKQLAILKISGYSHLDISLPQAIQLYQDHLLSFLTNPALYIEESSQITDL